MTRTALLLGIRNCGMGVDPVPTALCDVKAVYQTLSQSNIGYFDKPSIIVIPDIALDEEESATHGTASGSSGAPDSNGNGNGNGKQAMGDNGYICALNHNSFYHNGVDKHALGESSGASPNHSIDPAPRGNIWDSTTVSNTIQQWCQRHEPEDVALLFISGQYLCNRAGDMYLATNHTQVNATDLMEASAIRLDSVRRLLDQSRAQQQVVVLDCCFQGQHNAPSAAEERSHWEELLGDRHRVIFLPSAINTYCSGQKCDRLSLYTRYWLEGLTTGATAHQPSWISAADVHAHVQQQLAIAAPNLTPLLIDPGGIAADIRLGKTVAPESHRNYRQIVQDHLHQRYPPSVLAEKKHGPRPHLPISGRSSETRPLSTALGTLR